MQASFTMQNGGKYQQNTSPIRRHDEQTEYREVTG